VRIQCIEQFADLLPRRSAWNQLACQSPTNTIFQTFEWFESWWQVFGAAYELRVLLGFDEEALVAAAPLVVSRQRRYGRAWRCLEFAGGAPSDYLDFLYRDESAVERLIAACRADPAWDVLQLDRIPSTSPTLAALARAFPGWRGTRFVCDVCPAYVFSADADGAEILRKKSIRRHENGLKKAGVVEIRHLTRSEDIEPYLEAFFAQHIGRRATTHAPSQFLEPDQQELYRALTPRLSKHGWLLFTVVSLNAEPIAFHFGFVHGQRLVWYKPAFSVAHSHLSPGEVLLAALFRFCREHDLRELDFTIGEEAFKERFSNVKRQNMHVEVFRNPPLQRLGYAARVLKEKTERFASVQRVRREWEKVWGRSRTA
jgi:CelD/BcsL family acetyltransferase involved in cellulose biosynthesis